MIRKFIFFALLPMLVLSGFSIFENQEPDEENTFPPAIRELFSRVDRSVEEEVKILTDSLAVLWENNTFSPSQQDTILNALSNLQEMRMRAWPDLGFYLKTVMAISLRDDALELFPTWHEGLAHSLKHRSPRQTIDFMERSYWFFSDQIIYQSGSILWKIRKGEVNTRLGDNGLEVAFSGSDLYCYAQGDSTVVYRTSGYSSFYSTSLIANGGKITWERAGSDPAEVYALLEQFEVELTKPSFEADSAWLFHKGFFGEPLPGKVTERVLAEVQPENARFPRFDSYQQVHRITELFPGINYRGGFILQGISVLGSGTAAEPAILNFYKDDSLFVRVSATSFSIRSDRINSDHASASVYFASDSIHHPGLSMRYLHNNGELSLMRNENGRSRAPFSNTYHKMDMYCEALYWNIHEEEIKLQMIRGISDAREAIFESHSFFNRGRYLRMQGIDDMHPLSRLSRFSREVRSRTFSLNQFARHVRRPASLVKADLVKLSYMGLLSIDEETGIITLYDRLFHYIAANAGMADYDVIRINSYAGVNASINLDNFDLQMNGVERIPLSNAKNVVIHPHGQKVVMQGNRDMYFHGRIESGLFDFYGKEFYFNYDDFKINLINTDSMSFRVRSFEPDSRGRHQEVRVQTVLEGINGELLVDHPDNKSGRQPYPRYPIFNSNNESFVYYDHEETHDGIYDREKFYFQIIPFSIDSLDHASTDNIAFDGVFVSSGIFPEFHDYLTVQRDYSLGFDTSTPEDGFPLFGGKAHYTGTINMSNEGLKTTGQLNYLASTLQGEDMEMFPDSARGVASSFFLEEKEAPVEYPEVTAEKAAIFFLPDGDEMSITKTDEEMQVFGGLTGFKGKLLLSPFGLQGEGNLALKEAEMQSDHFEFANISYQAFHSDMQVKSPVEDDFALIHQGFDAEVDLKEQYAAFTMSHDEAFVEFPVNYLSGKMLDYSWNLADETMDFVSRGKEKYPDFESLSEEEWMDRDFSDYELVFTRLTKDSLRLYAPELHYRLPDNLLHASNVPLVRVADAAIFPHNQELFVEKGSDIRKLEEAIVIADTLNRFHRFYEAGIDIVSRRNYDGYGVYDYVNFDGEVQPVFFEQIGVNREHHTEAHTNIHQEKDFTLSPYFAYKGRVELIATQPLLTFDGASRIFADCPGLEPEWFRFNSPIDPDKVMIPLDDERLRNDNFEDIKMAMMLAGNPWSVYPALFVKREHYLDVPIVEAGGYVTYERLSGEYHIGSREKLANRNLPDNFIRFNTQNCLVQGEGEVNMGSDFGQFNLNTFGTVTHDLKENTVDYDLVMGLDFFFTDDGLDVITKSIEGNEALETINLNREKFRKYLAKNTNPENIPELMDYLAEEGRFRRLPPALDNTMFFGDVRFRWDQERRAFLSSGPIGIVNVANNQVHRYINGFIEIRKQRGGDIFTMILEPLDETDVGPGKEFFYFTFNQGVLQAISSLDEFNKTISELRPRQRRKDVDRGEQPFVYILSTEIRPFDFYETMMKLNQ